MTNKNLAGQSFFEVVLALALVTIVLVALVSLATLSVRSATFSKTKNMATSLSQEALEWLRGQRDNSWNEFLERATISNWCLPSLDWSHAGPCTPASLVPGTQIAREVTLTIIDPSTIQADVEAVWSDSQGSHQISSSTYFTKWK